MIPGAVPIPIPAATAPMIRGAAIIPILRAIALTIPEAIRLQRIIIRAPEATRLPETGATITVQEASVTVEDLPRLPEAGATAASIIAVPEVKAVGQPGATTALPEVAAVAAVLPEAITAEVVAIALALPNPLHLQGREEGGN